MKTCLVKKNFLANKDCYLISFRYNPNAKRAARFSSKWTERKEDATKMTFKAAQKFIDSVTCGNIFGLKDPLFLKGLLSIEEIK